VGADGGTRLDQIARWPTPGRRSPGGAHGAARLRGEVGGFDRTFGLRRLEHAFRNESRLADSSACNSAMECRVRHIQEALHAILGTEARLAALRSITTKNANGVRAAVGRRQEYRRYAQDCLEMANATDDPQVRATLLQMAQTWFRLADEPHHPGCEQGSRE
jgi:hypothetical protein